MHRDGAHMPLATGLRASGTLIGPRPITVNPQPANVLAASNHFSGVRGPSVEIWRIGGGDRVDPAFGRASRRPAAGRLQSPRRKGGGRASEPVSPPADSPVELLRTTPPHSLAPSDTINRCAGIQTPEMKRNESKEKAAGQGVRRSSRPAARAYLSAPAIRDTCTQSTVSARAPFMGAERVNLMLHPQSMPDENQKKDVETKQGGRTPH